MAGWCTRRVIAFLTALGAAALALAGNYLMLTFQTRQAVRAERRAFVRDLHAETVDLVVDLALFVRSLAARVVTSPNSPAEAKAARDQVEQRWEGDLMRRVRRAEFGHPDPDVREAAEQLFDDMWPFIVAAGHCVDDRFAGKREPGEGARAWDTVRDSLAELRRAVYAAPHRDVPAIRYDGAERPPRVARAAEARRAKESGARLRAGRRCPGVAVAA